MSMRRVGGTILPERTIPPPSYPCHGGIACLQNDGFFMPMFPPEEMWWYDMSSQGAGWYCNTCLWDGAGVPVKDRGETLAEYMARVGAD